MSDDQDEKTSPDQEKYAVVSGTGAGWGKYATLAEAQARRDYVARSHPNTRVYKRVN
jgi:hypothetical protein